MSIIINKVKVHQYWRKLVNKIYKQAIYNKITKIKKLDIKKLKFVNTLVN